MFRTHSLIATMLLLTTFSSEAVINNFADYRAFIQSTNAESSFSLTGCVTYVRSSGQFVLTCNDGAFSIRHDANNVHCGDIVCASGHITHFMPSDRATRTTWNSLHSENIAVIGSGAIPPVRNTSVSSIISGNHHLQEIRVEGIVEDIVPDDIDPKWQILILRDGGDTILVPLKDEPNLDTLQDARVAVTGLCVFNNGSSRSLIGWSVQPKSDSKLEIIETGNSYASSIPRLPAELKNSPENAIALGRRRTIGTVLAAWHGNLLVRDDNGRILRVETNKADTFPAGSRICGIGQVETDLFHMNLSRTHVRTISTPASGNVPPQSLLSEKDIYETHQERRAFKLNNLGRKIHLIGHIRSTPIVGIENSRALLSCNGIDVPLDFYACPAAVHTLFPGAKVAVDGILVFETENWRVSNPLPRVTGMFVSIAHSQDITVLKAPSWWTPRMLLWLIGSLVTILLGISVWTFSLRRLAERRGQALAAAGIAQAEAEFRIAERMRLSVELHDSVSQSLTGAALAIRAALRRNGNATDTHLNIALRTVDATRENLRNCIWDLRNRALEEADFTTAILRTLSPLISNEHVRIRFPVPRARFSDSSAHAIISVIRELIGNSLRHGHATKVALAGAVNENQLHFSVRDNGCGFNPDNCPGVEEGHFGLQGIRERIKAYNGTLTIVSNLQRGTKVTVTVSINQREEHE